MFLPFFKFELKYWFRAPMPWIFLVVFAMLTFGASISDNIQIGGSYGNVWKNAPFVAQNWYAVFSIMSLLLITAFLNSTAVRDFENNTAQIIFASPISKAGYYFGKFFGALVICLIPMVGISIGMWTGWALNGIFEWLPAERYGPFEVAGHLHAYVTFVIPNMLFAGGILYTVAMLTRSTMYSFIAAVLLLVGYIVSGNLMRDLQNEAVAALLDPFGNRPFGLMTKYWTVDEKNHQAVTLLHPGLLANRALWVAVGMAVLSLGYWRFDFSERKAAAKRRKKGAAAETAEAFGLQELGELPRVTPGTGWRTTLAQLGGQLRTDFKGTIKSTPFLLLSFIGLLNTVPNMQYATDSYGTHNFPVTYDMVDIIRGSFQIFVIAIVTYFTGALVWKERNAKVNEIYDALPTRNWTGYVAKYLSIVGVVLLLTTLAIGVGVVAQTLHGYTRYELGVYVRELLLLDGLGFACIAAAAMLIHVLSPNMYLGFFLSVMFIAVNGFIWGMLHVSSNMVDFASMPDYTISDFYGYRPYAKSLLWFGAYWLLFSALLGLAAVLLWVRGKDTAWRSRLRLAGLEWRHYRWTGLAAVGAWVLTAGFVFYNTKIENTYLSDKESEQLNVRYEKDYKKYQGARQPRIYDVKFDISLYPERRALHAKGEYWLRNTHPTAIDTLFVGTPTRAEFTLENERLRLLVNDSAVFFRIYRLEPALAPGDSMLVKFTSVVEPSGFENQLTWQELMPNGTFFNNSNISPSFGYQESGELTDKNDRKKYGLPEKSRLPALNPADTLARMNTYLSNDADWVRVETTISTSPDQIAIAPGSLLREWTENGRRYFHYKLDHQAWNFYSFMSATYEVARREHEGITYEVYYLKDHAYNVQRMLDAMQRSMEYYTENFGPYYHKQCRIIEFPRHSSFAQAFPGTMPYSEGIGFIENFREEEDDIDMVFYIVAHEMAHQYWAHQECGAQMQGSEMTAETFAQYSALMVMEKQYGRDQMRKFLEYEMDRYLRARGRETLRELPLAKCENQGYIHYNKGSVVMYYLREMIGEDRVNTGLKTFLEKYRYKPAPYPTSADPIAEFAAQTPDSLQYIIQDLFWDITLFENRTREASMKDLGNRQYEVTIQVECRKLKADELGKETEVAVNDWIEIGAFAKPEGDKKYGKTLYRQRVKIDRKDNTFTFVVDGKPHQAGIDPFSLLVDREPKDNLKEVGAN